jgi:hypothetical protein
MAGSGRDENHERTSAATPGKDAERRRLAEALRANLERRKTQKRVRQGHHQDYAAGRGDRMPHSS